MAGGIFFESDASHNAVVGLLVLEATLLLPLAQVLLLKLQKQGATTILTIGEQRWLQPRLCKNRSFGKATS